MTEHPTAQDVEKRLRESIERTLRDAEANRCKCVTRMDTSDCAIHGPATEEPTP